MTMLEVICEVDYDALLFLGRLGGKRAVDG
jgi:hypothetical protein